MSRSLARMSLILTSYIGAQGRKFVGSRCSPGGRSDEFNAVAEAAQFADHSLRSALCGLLADRGAPFLVTDTLVQNLPEQATKAMGKDADGLVVTQARDITAVEKSEDATLEFGGGIGGLIKNAPHMAVAFGRPTAGVDSRALVLAGAGPYPG